MDYKLIDRILALSNLIGQARLAYIEANEQLQVTSWNKGAHELFGYTEDDTVGKYLNDLIPVSKDALLACRKAGLSPCTQVVNSGQTIPCDIFYGPIMNTKGEKLGVAVLAKDISARLKDRENLKRQERCLTDIIGFAPVGIYHVTLEGNITSANPEYAWMLGYESSQALLEQVTDFASQVFYDEDRAGEFLFAVYEAEEVIRFRCRLLRKDGSFLWALCYAKGTKDETGRINGFNGFSINISETVKAEEQLKEANEKLKQLSVIDGLTQIPNRRRFDEYAASEWKRHIRSGKTISMILCDIDFFKLYNDHYGHQAGDECLQKVAQAIQTCAKRSSDLTARYGGEEFVLVLPETSQNGAQAVAERVRQMVENLEIPHEKSTVAACVTLSLGVATMMPKDGGTPEFLISMADSGLYKAKENGRNQIVSQ